MDWIIGLQKAIDYIENNLTDTIDYEKVGTRPCEILSVKVGLP